MKDKNAILLYFIIGLFLITVVFFVVVTLIFMGVGLTEPLPFYIAVPLVLPVGIYILLGSRKLSQVKRKRIYGDD